MRKEEKHDIIEQVRWKYYKANRSKKKLILDEIVLRYGYHRKHAIRLLRRLSPGRKASPSKRGRKAVYDIAEVKVSLKRIWAAMNFACSKLVQAAMPEWLGYIEKHYGAISDDSKKLLLQMSAATIDRLLSSARADSKHGRSGTKPGSIIRKEIPIRTGFWNETIPGFVEADTVAHCGGSLAGNFAWSITLTDIATTWTECRATWNKGAVGVIEQIGDIENMLPFPLLGFDSDNGAEFLNWHLLRYLTERNTPVKFTRSREYHKNDNAHVEQKNWSFPRQIFGYERFGYSELIPLMNDLYRNEISLLRNHFCPTFKLKERILVKARYRRKYDKPKTPYQRVMESTAIPEDKKQELSLLHQSLDPILLQRSIQKKTKVIFNLLKQLKREEGNIIRLTSASIGTLEPKVFLGIRESA